MNNIRPLEEKEHPVATSENERSKASLLLQEFIDVGYLYKMVQSIDANHLCLEVLAVAANDRVGTQRIENLKLLVDKADEKINGLSVEDANVQESPIGCSLLYAVSTPLNFILVGCPIQDFDGVRSMIQAISHLLRLTINDILVASKKPAYNRRNISGNGNTTKS